MIDRFDQDPSRVQKIKALCENGATKGERAAAGAALERVGSDLPVRITATVLDDDDGDSFYDVAFIDVENQTRTIRIRREAFQHRSQVVEQLIKAGANLPDDSKASGEIVKSAVDLKGSRIYRITRRPGWHDYSLVYHGRTFGKLDGKLVLEPPRDLDPALGLSNGTLEKWRDGLGPACKFSDYLIVTLAHKAANPLLELIGQEGVIFHLHGTENNSVGKTASSMGKTLATRVAATMTGRSEKNDLITFSISERATCDLCYAHNNLGIEIDEEGRSLGNGTGPRIRPDQFSYLVSSGRGSVRANRATKDKDLKNRTWITNAITSGEVPLDATTKRNPRSEGSQVRMIGIPVPPGDQGGIFNRVKGSVSERRAQCAELAIQVERTIAKHYGVAFPAYFAILVTRRDRLVEEVAKSVKTFMQKQRANKNPWETRFARPFAVDYAAAVLLSRFEIAPWTKKRAYRAISRSYRKARNAAATIDEVANALEKKIVKRLNQNRFPKLTKGKTPSRRSLRQSRHGFQRELPGIGSTLLLTMAQLENLVPSTTIVGPVVRHFASRGLVRLGPNGKLTQQVLVTELGEERRRYVCFDISALTNADQ